MVVWLFGDHTGHGQLDVRAIRVRAYILFTQFNTRLSHIRRLHSHFKAAPANIQIQSAFSHQTIQR